ncbi:MAG: transcription-repair coupling factor [Coriobacteriia bacterium]|nr:transcription-repair coupling factor [Coriobacteriia bacterium]
MLIDRLGTALLRAESYKKITDILERGDDATLAVPGLVRPTLLAALYATRPRSILAVTAGEEAAERLWRQTAAYLGRENVLHLPDRSDRPWGRSAPDIRQVGARARALHALLQGREVIVVASARALMRAVPPHGSCVFEPLVLTAGGEHDLGETVERLVAMGYQREDATETPGSFSVRGGVLDVFPASSPHPVRAEFFGDEVESIRRYVPGTGQSIADSLTAEVFPVRELSLSNRGAELADRALKERAHKDPQLKHDLDLMRAGVPFDGMERYLPLLYKRVASPVEYAAAGTLFALFEPRSLFDDTVRRKEELEAAAKEASFASVILGKDPLEGLYLSPAKLDFSGRQCFTLLSLVRAGGMVDAELPARRPEVSGGESKFLAGVRSLAAAGSSVVVAVPDAHTRGRIAKTLVAAGVAVSEDAGAAGGVAVSRGATVSGGVAATEDAVAVGGAADAESRSPAASSAWPCDPAEVLLTGTEIPSGFVVPDARLAVISIDDIFPRSMRRRPRRDIDPTRLTFSFVPGDYVVHAVHGIALFAEIVRREALGVERDYLLLKYAKGDRLFVPVDQIDRVTKYVGPQSSAPRVTRLNTADWSRVTGRARKAARMLAFDLVDLYARRAAVTGRAYGSDTGSQLEMEAMFPYEETPDQVRAIADVKADMESDKPMDRLICGDVGYGKTEVAIRAAFKAANDGAQVMVLCPTTILAQQHYTSFSERFKPFDVKVEVLSRFRTSAQQKASLAGFASGEVKMLVGTHRLLSRDVAPKNLGLVIIDEEQRFGVEHKEHLKNLREQVDVLSLSATPIPRTLQMSLSGVRDMSVIDTPPPDRFPVSVHVGEWDEDIVSGAIRRELERGGQVYYVSNRVRSIDDAVARVSRAAPEARIAVAHGQMSEKQLEPVMERFAANEADVLVATTIIESGIDNPHSNTLIIEDSQRLGLAQLYQLKGRVGRSHVKAFAYFLFPRDASLTEQAIERLTAISEHDGLGSGIDIAMKDLEIRGAGSLLGAEQHGNLSAVGFDLFAQMLAEAVVETRGEPPIAHPEVRVDLPVAAALIGEEYIPDVDERVRYYRRLSGSPSVEGVDTVMKELAEKHGPLPSATRNLGDIARIRAIAADLGIDTVVSLRNRVTASPFEPTGEERGRVSMLGAVYNEKKKELVLPIRYGESVMDAALALLSAIYSRVAVSTTGGMDR